jgi:phosphinothricin acetyltransferase
MQSSFTIRKATVGDLKSICDLQNHHILHTDDIYSEALKDTEELKQWMKLQKDADFPIIVAEVSGEFAGFATYGSFRKRACYATTVEHSVYLKAGFKGKGLGNALMTELFKIASDQEIHAMIGGIDSKNLLSIAFHQKLGFREVGRIPEVALKKGKWLELVLMQRLI